MAIIGKIRKHSSLTIIFVGVALLAFILGDLSKRGYGRGENTVGKIAGEDIPYIEFERKVEEQIELTKMSRQNQNLSTDEMFSIRNQVWNTYVEDIVLGAQYEKLGLTITNDEMFDLIAGETPHQYIVYNFSDPQTGQIDKERVLNLLQNLDQLEHAGQVQIANLFKLMRKDALQTKYRNLLNLGYYAPTVFAEMQYKKANENVSIEVAQLPYSAISDSTVVLTDADYQKYYNEHKESYKQEESRKIEYVLFDVKPSQEDYAHANKLIVSIYDEFATLPAQDIPLFVNANTDGAMYDSTWYPISHFPPNVAEVFSENAPGVTIAPYQEDDIFYTARLMATSMRSDTMDAEHILIAYKGAYSADTSVHLTKEQAKAKADSILNVVKKGAMPMSLLALIHSDDPSKTQNSGSFPRFADGTMVPEFNEAVQKGKTGDAVVVETVFGYHIIKIGKKNTPTKMLRVAMISRNIMPSDVTLNLAYTQATKFAGENTVIDSFRVAAERLNYNVREMDRVAPMANSLPSATQSRQIIKWAYAKDTKIGNVSKVFEGDYQFIVAALAAIHPKGYATMEEQKEMMKNQVIRDKKGEEIMAKVKGQTSTDVAQIATSFNGVATDAPIQVNFNTMSLPNNFGREQDVIGTALALNTGDFYGPIKGFNGVYFIKVSERIPAEPKENYDTEQASMKTGFSSRSSLYQKVLQEKAEIKDNRVLFY